MNARSTGLTNREQLLQDYLEERAPRGSAAELLLREISHGVLFCLQTALRFEGQGMVNKRAVALFMECHRPRPTVADVHDAAELLRKAGIKVGENRRDIWLED